MIAKIVKALLHLLLTLIGFIIKPILKVLFSVIYDGSAKTVSRIENELCLKTAADLARMIRSRKVL